MPQPSEHLIIQAYDRIVLVQVTKERLLDTGVINAIGAELTKLLDRYPKPSLILDLAPVAYLSSAMVGKIIALYKGVIALKGRLAIAGVRPELMPIFQITQIDRLIRFYPEAQQAILTYRKQPL